MNTHRASNPASEELTLPERARFRELEPENRELRLQAEFLRSRGLLRERAAVSAKYALIGAEKADPDSAFTVTLMCLVLGVSSSAFYAWAGAETSARAARRALLAVHVQAAFDAGRGTYGVRRVHAVLTRSDVPAVACASPKLVRSVLAELGLKACQPRAYKRTTLRDEDADPPSIPDLLGRDFSAPAPGLKLVGDIT